MSERISKIEYYMSFAQAASQRSTCLRRCYGCVVVRNDSIVSTGYNGSPRGMQNCSDLNRCYRKENNTPSGKNYELCVSTHSEQNCIVNAARTGTKIINGDWYLYGFNYDYHDLKFDIRPCNICANMILNCDPNKIYVGNCKEIKELTINELKEIVELKLF